MTKILILSDYENSTFFKNNADALSEIEFIISCGDLSAEYLEDIFNLLQKPLFYLKGNHGSKIKNRKIKYIGNKVFSQSGFVIAGVDGIWQRNSQNMIKTTEKIMKYRGNIDILVSHSPCEGIGDGTNYHKGAPCLNKILRAKNIRYHFYGHNHLNYGGVRYIEENGIKFYNAFDHFVLTL